MQFDFNSPDENNIIYEEGNDKIKGATFPKLIEKLTDPGNIDRTTFLRDFLLTYRSFTTSDALLEALITRYKMATNPTVGLRVYTVIQSWAKNYWYDFCKDPALEQKVCQFLGSATSDPHKKVAGEVLQKIERMKVGKTVVPATLPYPPPVLPKDPTKITSIFDFNAKEIARQLTLIEWNMWKEIQPWECLNLAWMKKDNRSSAPHVMELIDRFNYVSGWVAYNILTTERLKERIRVCCKLVEVAMELHKLSNFNGVMEIISGFNRTPVYRLNQTWQVVETKEKLSKGLQELREITSNTKSYANLRKAIRDVNPPCIPYLGMYLTDLTFIEENPDFLDENNQLVNFFKRRLISDKIKEIQTYQQQSYILLQIDAIQQKLKVPINDDEDTLQELSLYLQPRPGKEPGSRPQALGGPPPPRKVAKPPKFDLEYKKEWHAFYIADSPSNINVNSTNVIISGTITKIIERLTHHSAPDCNSLLPFLATFRGTTKPEDLLNLLIIRHAVPDPIDKSEENMEKFRTEFQTPIFLRVFNFIKNWITLHWYDFEENPLLKSRLMNFIKNLNGNTSPQFVEKITSIIESNEKLTEKFGTPENFTENLPPVSESATILNFEPPNIAQEITYRTRDLFDRIQPEEILAKADPKAEKSDRKFPYLDPFLELGRNFEKLVNFELFTAVQKGNVSEVAYHLLEVARQCLLINNWEETNIIVKAIDRVVEGNSMLAEDVQSAWEKISGLEKQLGNTELKLSDVRDHFTVVGKKKLEEKLRRLRPPCIPVMDVFLDLTQEAFIEHPIAVNTTGDNVLINMERIKATGEIVTKIMLYQKKLKENSLLTCPSFRAYQYERQSIAESTPSLVTTKPTPVTPSLSIIPSDGGNSEKSDRSDSEDDAYSELSPRLLRPSYSKVNFAKKGLLELLTGNEQFRKEVSGIVREVIREEMERIKTEIQIISTTLINKLPLEPQQSQKPPLWNIPTIETSIKDPVVCNTIYKAFPGSQLVAWKYFDTEGIVSKGNPGNVHINIIQKDINYFLLDVQDKVGIEEIARVMHIGKLFTKVHPGVPIGCVIVMKEVSKQDSVVAQACKIKLLKI